MCGVICNYEAMLQFNEIIWGGGATNKMNERYFGKKLQLHILGSFGTIQWTSLTKGLRLSLLERNERQLRSERNSNLGGIKEASPTIKCAKSIIMREIGEHGVLS